MNQSNQFPQREIRDDVDRPMHAHPGRYCSIEGPVYCKTLDQHIRCETCPVSVDDSLVLQFS